MPTNLFLMQKKLITLFLLTTLLTLGMKAQTESTYRKEIGIGIDLNHISLWNESAACPYYIPTCDLSCYDI